MAPNALTFLPGRPTDYIGLGFTVTVSVAFSVLFTSLLAVTKYPAKKQLRGGDGHLWFTEQEALSWWERRGRWQEG